jgi:hypothetical protein
MAQLCLLHPGDDAVGEVHRPQPDLLGEDSLALLADSRGGRFIPRQVRELPDSAATQARNTKGKTDEQQ